MLSKKLLLMFLFGDEAYIDINHMSSVIQLYYQA